MSIPAEAVMVAAKAYCDRGETDLQDWTAEAKAELLDDMRACLEAAAPHMHAETTADALRAAWDRGYATATDGMKGVPAYAWDEGYDAGVREEQPGWTKNPYRTAK